MKSEHPLRLFMLALTALASGCSLTVDKPPDSAPPPSAEAPRPGAKAMESTVSPSHSTPKTESAGAEKP